MGDYLEELGRKGSGDPVPHQVLNARYHEQEANIIAQAGVPGTVTIATNMAGRGTDIQLGGNDRFRARDWLKEEIEAGRMAAVHGDGDDDEPLRTWVDDVLYAGDEWIDARLRQWVDGQDRRLDQGAVRTAAAGADRARAVARERARIQGDKRGLALRARRDRQELAAAARSAGVRNGHDDEAASARLVRSRACATRRASGSRMRGAPGASAASTRPCSVS